MANKGRHSFYTGKIQQPVTTNFTQEVRDVVRQLQDALSVSASDVQEHALRKLAGLPVNADLEALLTGALHPVAGAA